MDIKKIVDTIYEYLPSEIKDKKSLQELKRLFLNITKNLDFVDIDLNEEIKHSNKYLEEEKRVLCAPTGSKIIFNLERPEYKELCFTLYKKENDYAGFLTKTEKEDFLYNTTVVDLIITKSSETFKITCSKTDDNGFYYDYNTEIYSFNNHGEEVLVEDIELEKDKDFSSYFGIPLEYARTYRLNFDKNKNIINNYLTQKSMNKMDELYFNDSILFTPPFTMNTFSDFLMDGVSLDDEDIDEEIDEDFFEEEDEEELPDDLVPDIEEEERLKSELELFKEKLEYYVGSNGKFVMSYNLFINIQSYLQNNLTGNIKGFLIKKENNEYTIYYININELGLLVFPKSINKSDLLALYNSNKENALIYGLNEFFEINKKKKL